MKSAHRLLAVACCGAVALACFAGPSAEAQPDQAAVAPPGPPPTGTPPPPPGYAVPDGEWIYTQQYGWIWMTTGDQYVYVPPDGTGEPLEFVFYGGAWNWVAAPWVWGYGPRPFWGRARPDRFAWYRHGYWRQPSRWRYTPAPGRGAMARSGVGVRAPPPARATAPPARGRGGGQGQGQGQEGGGERGGAPPEHGGAPPEHGGPTPEHGGPTPERGGR